MNKINDVLSDTEVKGNVRVPAFFGVPRNNLYDRQACRCEVNPTTGTVVPGVSMLSIDPYPADIGKAGQA